MPEPVTPAAALLEEITAAHQFTHSTEGDGWSEPLVESYDCSCSHSHYGFWVQEDPRHTGRRELHDDVGTFLNEHSAHLVRVLTPALEAAWDAGHESGTRQAARPTRIDLAGDHNPYRRGQDTVDSQAVRYPRRPVE